MSSESSPQSPPPRRFSGVTGVAIFIAVTVVFVMAYMQYRQAKHAARSALPILGEVPAFVMTDQDGKTVSKNDLLGKIWVADFAFTTCPGPCPLITSRMVEIQQALDKIKDKQVKLVTFTVDPVQDTPAVLKDYSVRVKADTGRWSFLTGEPTGVQDFIVKGMLQPLMPGEDNQPIHSTRFVIVDGNGSIRAFRDGMDPEVVGKVLMDIGTLMRERSASARRTGIEDRRPKAED